MVVSSALSCWIPGHLFFFSSQIIHLEFWSISPTLPSLPINAFYFCPRSGLGNVLSLCSRQVSFLLDWGGEKEAFLYFLLCFSFWLLITEFSVGNGEIDFVLVHFWQQRSMKTCALITTLTWTIPLQYYVNLLNFELFPYL